MDTIALIEISLLVIAYTVLTITIFLEYVCYKRNLETPQTIFFTASLLLLIIALTVSPFLNTTGSEKAVNIFMLFSFILVGLTTPLNVFTERDIKIEPVWTRCLVALSVSLVMLTIAGYFFEALDYAQYAVVSFLGISVAGSMILVQFTKPLKRLKHREKVDRIFAIAFIVLVPLSLVMNFVPGTENLKIGFTIPLVFILLAGIKLWDDMQRLSLLRSRIEPREQTLLNYQLTEREKEIAIMLSKGKTYKQISEVLFISLPTVKSHSSNIYRKCGVNTRSELTALIIN